ncbi:hypothetical protein WA026_004861 [Henosepilachna vigintioctopunctata]
MTSGRTDDVLSLLGSEEGEYCMTNGTSAMYYTARNGGIYEGTELLPRSPYFCDFEDNNKCVNDFKNNGGGYKIVNSSEYENWPIFDMRWEDLPVAELYHIRKSDTNRLSFTPISKVKHSENFNVTLSVRSTQVHFLLCDKKDVTSANCYWFIIQGWKGNKSVLRKCSKQIPDVVNEYPKNPCKHPVVTKTHPDDYQRFLNFYKWTHLTLEKQGPTLYLRNIENGVSDTIIEYTDGEDVINVEYLLGHTKDSIAYYKLHKHQYLRTSQPSENIIAFNVPVMEVKNRKICFSVLLTTCRNCWTTFSAFFVPEQTIEFIDHLNVRPSYGIWTEHKFEIENVNHLFFNIGIGNRLQQDGSDINLSSAFWALDNFRQCHDKEYRVSMKQVKNLKKCFLIYPAKEAEWQNPELSYMPEKKCRSWQQLGDSCIPCNLLKEDNKLGTCENLRACEFTSNGSKCFCSPGSTGPECKRVCEPGTYGYGCSQQCGNCFSGNECRIQDGVCASCTYQFQGSKCQIPKYDIILKYPPSILKSSPSTCTIQLVNYEYLGKLDFNYYLVQRQKVVSSSNVASGANAWTDCGPIRTSEDTDPVVVEGLKSSTEYRIRILIASQENKLKKLGNAKVPFSICNTTCSVWEDSDIKLTPRNASVEVSIKLSEEKCSASYYNWTIQDKYGKNVLADIMSDYEFTIGPLGIYKSYTIVFNGLNSIVKEFRTSESVPSEVHGVFQEKSNINSVEVSWSGPRYPNGIIDHYRIEYKKIRGLHCTEERWEDAKEMNVSLEVIELAELYPYSVYIVTIYAVNSKYESKGVSVEVKTAGIDEFSEDEGLAQVGLNINPIYERSAIISVDNLNCQNLRGPLEISYNFKCESKWCKSVKVFTGTSSPFRETAVIDLQPFCDYSCSIFFCRKDNCKTIFQKEFQTKASVPNSINELSVYSKGENYVHLRWLPPYPPTGTLKYRIIYTCESCVGNHRTTENFKPKNCSRWKNFHCAVLTKNIYEKYTHSINIEAANEENGIFISVHNKFDVYVEESTSEPPYNLKTRWHENNTLELLWNHPNVTNGNLKAFLIELTVASKTTTFPYPITEKKDTLLYHIMLDKVIPSSRDVYIKVYAENSYLSNPAKKTDSSFPVHPRLINSEISITNYTETTISISLNTSLKNDDKNNAKYLFVLRSQLAAEGKDQNLLKLEEILNKKIDNETNLRLVAEINLNDKKGALFEFVVGQNERSSQTAFLNAEISNEPLQKSQYYNISILLVNDYKKKYTTSVYSIRSLTQGDSRMTTESSLPNDGETVEPSQGNGGYYALFLLLLIPIILGAMFYYRKKYQSSPPISVNKIMEATIRSQTQSRFQNEVLLLESKEPNLRNNVPNVIVRPNLSRKSTNPPNESQQIFSKPVKVAYFEEYVKQTIQSGELTRQHSLFPRGQTQPCTYGSMKVNKMKNRYNNLIAYDHSRVKLAKIAGDEYSDYINASYIHGYNVPRAYIATQGPKSSTLVDFWRMIWQENVKHIVMLANIIENGKKKVEQYWPNINEELVFGNITVQYVSVETYADFEYKIFHVTSRNQMRKLEQFHYTSWPDHGVPLYPQSLVPFLRKILKIPQSSSSPIVVHCSAGVGRTGTILLSDICLRMAAKEGVIDILNNLQKLREQRSNMVDNVEQFKLVHLIVLESLMGLHTSIPINDIEKAITKLINEEEYKIQMDYLRETEWQDQAMMSLEDMEEEFITYPEKNRFQDIVPDNRSRIFLTRYPSDDSSSSYINAVQVDGFRCPNRFIVTQQPMPNTLGDFWRLVVERHTSVIVSLNETNTMDKTCCHFYPTSDNPELRPTDFILIKFEKEVALDHYDIHSVRVFATNHKEHLDVDIISFKKWPTKVDLPLSCEEFLSFWEEADAISRRSKTILVSCYDGKTACGVYVSLCFVIEKIKLEQECDVCLAVRNVRHNRKQFVSEESQFIFLYEAALRYINGFESYANFQNQ